METKTTSSDVNVDIRLAAREDCSEIMRLIIELAESENMADQVKMTTEVLERDMFGDNPICRCLVAAAQDDTKHLIGYALYYPMYSPWDGVCLSLEDLYVTAPYRGTGVAKSLWQRVNQIALDMGCGMLQFWILNWNKYDKNMYERSGVLDLTESEDWHLMRMNKNAIGEVVRKAETSL